MTTPDTADPHPPATVEHHTTKPLGVMPRHAQSWIVGGLAVVMVVIIALSGRQPTDSAARAVQQALAPAPLDPNQARIDDYKKRVDEQSRRLAAEQEQLTRTLAARRPAASSAGASSRAVDSQRTETPDSAARHTIAEARAKRDYESLFADNLAVSARPIAHSPASSATPALSVLPSPAETVTPPAPALAPPSGVARASVWKPAPPPAAGWFRLMEGTLLEAVLTNRLVGAFAGPVNCLVTTPVYADDHQTLLIPDGSRLLGEARPVTSFGQQRLAVSFHRLIMPNRSSVDLDRFQALDQAGETGLADEVNNHYLKIFGISVALGAISGLAQGGTRYGPDGPWTDLYRQGAGTSVAQSSTRILDRFLNLLPTITIREGHRIRVYLTQDVDLPAYNDGAHP